MNWGTFVVCFLTMVFPLVAMELDYMLYNSKHKHLIEQRKVLTTPKELKRELLRINYNEVFLFMAGYLVCLALTFMGWA